MNHGVKVQNFCEHLEKWLQLLTPISRLEKLIVPFIKVRSLINSNVSYLLTNYLVGFCEQKGIKGFPAIFG